MSPRPRPSYEQQAAKIRSLQTHKQQLLRERDEALELAARAVIVAKEKGHAQAEKTSRAVEGARERFAAADAARSSGAGSELEPGSAAPGEEASAEQRQRGAAGPTENEAGKGEAQ